MHSLVLYSTLVVDLVVSLYVCSPLAVLGLGRLVQQHGVGVGGVYRRRVHFQGSAFQRRGRPTGE